MALLMADYGVQYSEFWGMDMCDVMYLLNHKLKSIKPREENKRTYNDVYDLEDRCKRMMKHAQATGQIERANLI